MSGKCEIHENCDEPVVACIGLPTTRSKWVCLRGFWEWRQSVGEKKS